MVNNKQMAQTAVEWLVNQEISVDLGSGIKMKIPIPQNVIDKAKQMEKEQHQKTFKQSRQAKIFEDGMPPVWESFEQYYNETFGNK